MKMRPTPEPSNSMPGSIWPSDDLWRPRVRGLAVGAVALALLVGCEDSTDQDTGESRTTLTGQAFDGPIARGEVYLDRGEDYRRDRFDPRARSDRDGEFELEAVLSGARDPVLRVQGGRDRFHGQDVPVTLSRSVENSDARIHISPITSLLSEMSDDQRDDFLVEPDAHAEDVNFLERHVNGNYLDLDDDDFSDEQHLHLIRIGYQLQKLVEVVDAATSGDWLNDEGAPPDASVYAYPALADRFVQEFSDGDSKGPEDWVKGVLEEVDAVAEAAGEDPQELAEKDGLVKDLVALRSELIGGEEGLFSAKRNLDDSDDFNGFDEDQLRARARAVEAATIVLRAKHSGGDGPGLPAEIGSCNGLDIGDLIGEKGEDETLLGYSDWSNGDVEGFTEALDVARYAEAICDDDGFVDPEDHQRDTKLDLGDDRFEAGGEDEDYHVRRDGDRVRVDVDESSFTVDWEEEDDYTANLEVEVGGNRIPATLRTRSDGRYEFEFQGERYSSDIPDDG